jgi:hypothetical protein
MKTKTKKPELVPVVTQYPCGPPVEPLTPHPAFTLPWMRRLWAHLYTEHALILTQDELFQIVRIVREDDVKRKSENSA